MFNLLKNIYNNNNNTYNLNQGKELLHNDMMLTDKVMPNLKFISTTSSANLGSIVEALDGDNSVKANI